MITQSIRRLNADWSPSGLSASAAPPTNWRSRPRCRPAGSPTAAVDADARSRRRSPSSAPSRRRLFEFLDFGGGQLGLVIGDVSGKGLGAALLMANLQAHVRSHYARSRRFAVALLIGESPVPAEHAVGELRDALFCRLRRPHAPIALGQLRALAAAGPPRQRIRPSRLRPQVSRSECSIDGRASRTKSNSATVTCSRFTRTASTQALDAAGNEFGVERLVEVLRAGELSGAQMVLDRAVTAVRDFSHDEQQDDITMVVARVRQAVTPYREALALPS